MLARHAKVGRGAIWWFALLRHQVGTRPPSAASAPGPRWSKIPRRMRQVNSCGESLASERDFEPPPAQGAQLSARNGSRIQRPDWRAERRTLKASWRRERNCRQNLSALFSTTYESHKLRWMLPGESWGCF